MKYIFILISIFFLNGCISFHKVDSNKIYKFNLGLKSANCFKTRKMPYSRNMLYESLKLMLLQSKFKIITSNQEEGTITATGHIIIKDNNELKIVYLMNSFIIKKMDNISYIMIDSSYKTDKFTKNKYLKESQITLRYPLIMHKSQLKIGSFGDNEYNGFYRMFFLNIYQAVFNNQAKYYTKGI